MKTEPPLRTITYEARDRSAGMTPAEVTAALVDALRIRRCRTGMNGRIIELVVEESWHE